MMVSPSVLYGTGAALRELAGEINGALAWDRSGPGAPAWATDAALRGQVAAWDAYLAGLAGRLSDAGDRLICAADGYRAADSRAVVRWGRLLC
jgi:hypothetical protein